MNDDLNMISFGIIADASEARSLALEAYKDAEKGDLSRAREHLGQAHRLFEKARRAQTDVLFEEMNGKTREVNVLLVHSQDHITSADVIIELVERVMPVIEEQKSLKARVSEIEERMANEN